MIFNHRKTNAIHT